MAETTEVSGIQWTPRVRGCSATPMRHGVAHLGHTAANQDQHYKEITLNEPVAHAQTQTEMVVTEEMLGTDSSRRDFLTKLMAGAAAATTLTAVPASVFASTGRLKHVGAAIPAGDAAILNFALTLEHLEAAFYGHAASRFGTRGTYFKRLIGILHFDETSHVNALTQALRGAGVTPVARQARYNFGKAFNSRHDLLSFSAKLETTGVHAYLGQAGNIQTKSILLTAATIVTVEARHTGAVNALLQHNPTEGPFDQGFTKDQIVRIITPILG